MSHIYYNGIPIWDVQTDSIEITPVMDMGEKNMIARSYNMRFTGVISTVPTPTAPGANHQLLGIRESSLEIAIRDQVHKLSIPGYAFILYFGSSSSPKEVLSIVGRREIRNVAGLIPKPTLATLRAAIDNSPMTTCRILQVVSATSARVEFTLKAKAAYCPPGTGNDTGDVPGVNANPFISYSLAHAETYGADFLRSIVYSGTAQVNQSYVYERGSAMFYKHWLIPPKHPQFVRKLVSFQESADGSHISFRIEDHEFYEAPPFPALSWDCEHTVNFPNPGMNYAVGTVDMRITIPPDVQKQTAILLLYTVMWSRLQWGDIQNPNNNYLTSLSFTDHKGKPEVSGHAAVTYTSDAKFFESTMQLGTPLDGTMNIDTFDTLPYSQFRYQASPGTHFISALWQHFYDAGECGYYVPEILEPWPVEPPVVRNHPAPTPPSQSPPPGGYTPPPYQRGQGSSPSGNGSSYLNYFWKSWIWWKSGVWVMPTGAPTSGSTPTTTTRPVSAYPPRARRIIQASGMRINSWPELPNTSHFTDANGIVHILRNHLPEFDHPQYSADNRKTLYGAGGTFVYDLSRAPTQEEAYPVGTPPYLTVGDNIQSQYPPTAFLPPNSPMFV